MITGVLMIYLGVVIGIALMGGMIFLAFRKKSEFAVRVASLIALGVMMLTIIICLFLVFTDDRVPVDESVVIVGAAPEIKEVDNSNMMVLFLVVIVLIAVFAMVVIAAMREYRKNKPKLQNGMIPL